MSFNPGGKRGLDWYQYILPKRISTPVEHYHTTKTRIGELQGSSHQFEVVPS
jgi:hypothetical protein